MQALQPLYDAIRGQIFISKEMNRTDFKAYLQNISLRTNIRDKLHASTNDEIVCDPGYFSSTYCVMIKNGFNNTILGTYYLSRSPAQLKTAIKEIETIRPAILEYLDNHDIIKYYGLGTLLARISSCPPDQCLIYACILIRLIESQELNESGVASGVNELGEAVMEIGDNGASAV